MNEVNVSDNVKEMFAGVEMSAWNDVDVTFANPRFVQNPQYTNDKGEMPIILSVDMTNEDGDVREDQLFPFGGDYFKIVDGGAAVEAVAPKLQGSNGLAANTKLQVLLNTILDCDADMVAEHFETVKVGPRVAAFWDHLHFHLVEKEIPNRRNPAKPYRQQTCTKLISWGDDAPEPVKAPAAKKAAVKRPAKPAPKAPVVLAEELATVDGDVVNTFGLDEANYAILRDIALGSATFEDFQAAAYDNDVIVEDGVQEVADDDGEGGLFATLTSS